MMQGGKMLHIMHSIKYPNISTCTCIPTGKQPMQSKYVTSNVCVCVGACVCVCVCVGGMQHHWDIVARIINPCSPDIIYCTESNLGMPCLGKKKSPV